MHITVLVLCVKSFSTLCSGRLSFRLDGTGSGTQIAHMCCVAIYLQYVQLQVQNLLVNRVLVMWSGGRSVVTWNKPGLDAKAPMPPI